MKLKRWEWALFAVCLLSPLWGIRHPLWEVDDARYAEIPREMIASGDWVIPHLDFVDYVEKPPLPYWITAVSYLIFGMHEWSARLPLALWAVLSMLLVFRFGKKFFDLRTGVYASIILAVSLEFFSLGRIITPDYPLTFFLLGAQVSLAAGLLTPGKNAPWLIVASGAFCGLAFLAKGLPGIIFPLLWAAVSFLFPSIRRKIRFPPLWSVAAGFAAFVIIALPWFAAMEFKRPGFFKFFFWEQHFVRYLSPVFQRDQPWYFFIFADIAGFLPWTFFLAGAAYTAARRWRDEPSAVKALLLWTIIIIAFFSKSHSKLVTYILPVFPQQALLAAYYLTRPEKENRAAQIVKICGIALGAALIAAGPVSMLFLKHVLPFWAVDGGILIKAVTAPGLLGASILAGFVLFRPAAGKGWRTSFAFAVLAVGGLATNALLTGYAADLSGYLSAWELSSAINRRIAPGDEIISCGVYLHGVPYYTGLPVKVVNWRGELRYAEKTGKFPERFGTEKDIERLPAPDKNTFVIFRRKEIKDFMNMISGKRPAEIKPFGEWMLAVFPKKNES